MICISCSYHLSYKEKDYNIKKVPLPLRRGTGFRLRRLHTVAGVTTSIDRGMSIRSL